ncbi:MAG: DUF2235 domain-containing protein [Cypionkella sp.]|nr:DUF2235 domain-containing protein [Cypionkella sp.]
MSLIERARRWWRGYVTVETSAAEMPLGGRRGPTDHVIILDGTLSTLEAGQEGNAGLLYHLLTEGGARHRHNVYYEPGQQWEGWRQGIKLIEGRGINPAILRAYGWLASHYIAGDRIFLFGYSRGAYAVRALAGMVGRVGLLRREEATQSAVNLAFRHYMNGAAHPAAQEFNRVFCHPDARIRMIGVWDTVKALGLRLPILWRFVPKQHDFHDHYLGTHVDAGFQALALNETRAAFRPELWATRTGVPQNLHQVWFAGAHGDVGGNIGRYAECRPLANIPLVWMLEQSAQMGLELPPDWREKFPCDANAPMVGTRRGFGLWFMSRARRKLLRDPSEALHDSVAQRRPNRWWEF